MAGQKITHLLVEQTLVLLILILHLSGFMDVSHGTSSSVKKNFTKNEVGAFIEDSKYFKEDETLRHKTVLVVIDAWRVDQFVTAEKPFMEYSKQLLETKQGIGYLLKTNSPTVTLPRIKSMITGTTHSFMDVIFNFASSELKEENIIDSAARKGIKTVFYGDDSWIRLLPRSFHHKEGVTSFFVSDYTEVDANVTRHLPRLFSNDDWDFLVLHYVGLDHIGHLEGPASPLIGPKLKEMDDVVKSIHHYLKGQEKPYLLMVCGDHGMADAGGHGGDTHSEIWTSTLMVSHFNETHGTNSYSSVTQRIRNQVDLASTLALHLGVEIPVQNVGNPFHEYLEWLPVIKQFSAHYRVSKQLMNLASQTQEGHSLGRMKLIYDSALKLHRNAWRNETVNRTKALRALNSYKEFELLISSLLIEKMVLYDLPLLLSASVILIMVSVPTIIWTLFLSTEICSPIYGGKLVIASVCGGVAVSLCRALSLPAVAPSSYVAAVLFVYGLSNLHSFVMCFTKEFTLKVHAKSFAEFAIVAGVVIHPFSLLATSLVEEEHFSFYFMTSFVYFLFLVSLARKRLELRRDSKKLCRREEAEFIKRDLVSHQLSSCERVPPVSHPVLYNCDSRLFLALNGREEGRASRIVYAYEFRRRHEANFILVLASWTLFRLLRAFNATGDKWKGLTHINDFLKDSEGLPLIISILCGLSICMFLFRSSANPVLVLLALVAILGRHFPLWDRGIQSGILEAQLAYACLLCLLIYSICKLTWYKRRNRHCVFMGELNVVVYLFRLLECILGLLFILLQRPENVLASSLSFLHFHLIIPIIIKNFACLGLKRTHAYVFAFWVGQAHFFIEGNSNSLATVQVNSGFVGISSYHPVLHGLLIAWHTFGAKFLVYLHTLTVVICFERKFEKLVECLRCWWMLQLLTLTVYVINVTLQRYHLFILSVFVPKLMYEESHFVCLALLTLVVFGCVTVCKKVSTVK